MKKFFTLTAFLLVACSTVDSSEVAVRGPSGERFVVDVEYALTPEQHERGLMSRTELAPDSGMLFVFASEQQLTFWMKNTLIPLDILYFDSAKRFVSSTTMQPCDVPTCPLYPSARPAMYALEVPAGWLAAHPVKEGWMLETK